MSEKSIVYDRFSCAKCSDESSLDFDFTMAFSLSLTAKAIRYLAMKRWLEALLMSRLIQLFLKLMMIIVTCLISSAALKQSPWLQS